MNNYTDPGFPENSAHYRAGRKAREEGAPYSSCPFGIARLFERCLWCAGFNDRDMELNA